MEPLGIMPKEIWMKMRLQDLEDAITRYKDRGMPVPAEWVTEYNELLEEIKEKF